eukprot:15366657-Alexandrium_andersonii.AAC.1
MSGRCLSVHALLSAPRQRRISGCIQARASSEAASRIRWITAAQSARASRCSVCQREPTARSAPP